MTTTPPRTTTSPGPGWAELALSDLAAELVDVTHERDQADAKAGAWLAGVVGVLGAELAALVTVGGRLSPWALAGVLASLTAMIGAGAALGVAIRPAVRGSSAARWGFLYAANRDPAELVAEYTDRARDPQARATYRAVALVDQARRVRRKYTRVRWGVDLAGVGLALAVLAAILAVAT